jgi:hypothetical protein
MTTTTNKESSRMSDKIGPRTDGFKVRTHLSHDVRLAELWGCQVTTAHNRRMLVGQWIEDVLHCYKMAGDTASTATLLARIDAATAAQVPLSLPDAQYQAACADTAEDTAEAAWIRHGSDQALEMWIGKLSQELYAGTELLAHLRSERTRRRAK